MSPLTVSDRVAVIGAGTMGGGIALVAAAAGHEVALHDSDEPSLERAVHEIEQRLARDVAKDRRSPAEAGAVLERIHPVAGLAGIGGSRLVVEAIVEQLDAKQQLFAAVETVVGPDAVLASNTSSLDVSEIARSVARPERVVGMHFFNPPALMPLVEVVRGAATDESVISDVVTLARAWGKTPVVCRSSPGFIVNRVARPFYSEALRLVAEGAAAPNAIDAIVVGAGGFRMGPFTLMDLVGLDVNLAVSTSVYQQTGDARFEPSPIQQELVAAGHLGRKSGRGFFRYDDAGRVETPAAVKAPTTATHVRAIGDLGHAAGLVSRLVAEGMDVDVAAGDDLPARLEVDGAVIVPGDGRPASDLVATFGTGELAQLDLVLDWSTASCVAVAAASGATSDPAGAVAALLDPIEVDVVEVGDVGGLVLMRIMAQLASVAADAEAEGVASGADIDTAMRLGTNYPIGPSAWGGDHARRLVVVLDHLRDHYGEERYEAAARLRSAARREEESSDA